MYRVIKTIEVSGAHHLKLDYESKCQRLHGHNWKITITCETEKLNNNGMVVDFTDIKRDVEARLDHRYLNEVVPFNPTAENIAEWIAGLVPNCVKVSVQESEGNVAEYEVPRQ